MDNASSSNKLPRRKYDVLINFTGEDIHRKFVSHLNSAFSTVGLTTFLHHPNAVKSTHIQQPILSHCHVGIVVFTQTYSKSAWCLDQLQQIIKWHETYCRHVLPVYYEIQPSDVRLQKGDFGKALKETAQQTFSGEELEDGMSRWRHALTKAANFFGWDERNHRSDAELVDKIVKSVINLPVLSATKFPVGLQSHVEDLIRTINSKSTEVCYIEIRGEEGSGKTTLAKAIYNQIHWTFKKKSFIENISQVSGIRGRLRLQEQLLLDVLKQKVEIPSIDLGRSMIRKRLSGKRVLIVLDDVSYFSLFDLWNCGKWFGEGTVIIVTSTFEKVVKDHANSFFRVEPLNAEESLELLSWHAFREAKPKEEYEDLARRVVSYCGGLPLALEVIGSTLFEKTKEEWNSLLFKFRIDGLRPDPEIIKVSIEGSLNEMEKDIFLDICCFFVGESRAYVRKILNGCGVDADIAIRVLIQRNLIKINRNNKLGMHPLLQEIGIKIIYENSVKDIGKNRRLWFDKDAKYGTEPLQWLPVEPPSVRIALGEPIVNSEYLLKKLRWIRLHGFSSECLPNNSYEDNSTTIDLKRSLLRFVWKTPQVLRSLKVLNLSHSKHLTTTPDFTGLPSLEHLILKYCSRLSKVHRSIGSLKSLILLNLKYCTSLYNLPKEIYDLKSLRIFILSGCSKIHIMDKDIVQMESLITLIAGNKAVKEVPFSIVSSKNIGYISLQGFEGLSHNFFPSIIRSWMSATMSPISYIHSLCMGIDNSWEDIGPLLSSLENLRSVLVQCHNEFQLSEQVKFILVDYFSNITESGISKQHLRCSLIGVGAYHQFFNVVSDNIYQVLSRSESCDVCLPAVNDHYCLAHMGEGHSVSFVVPEDGDMKGMILCVVYLSTPKIIEPEFTTIVIVNYNKCTFQIHNHGTAISFKEEDWHGIMSNLECGDNVEIFVNFGNGLVVKNTTVYLIWGEAENMEKPCSFIGVGAYHQFFNVVSHTYMRVGRSGKTDCYVELTEWVRCRKELYYHSVCQDSSIAFSSTSMDIASSSYKLSRKYDVFINFTGEDIHRKFVSHLNSVLSTVVKSSHIQESILSHCRVAIVVFTQTYSQSGVFISFIKSSNGTKLIADMFCLYIMKSNLLMYVFRMATAQQAFSGQELEHGMSRWRHALTKAANFFGWDESNHRSDAEPVDKIVKSVINLSVLSATKFPVGLQSQVEDLIRTIKNKSNEVYMIGKGGEEGSGKTTLAKAIYNQIHWKFNKKSFIENISQVSEIRGQLRLQEKLLLDVVKQKVEIPNIDVGRSIIRERLSEKRVLIVLDDLPANYELLALWNYSHNWFGEGTVIIITITEFGVMSKYPVDSVFRIKLMNEEESLELLSWHAFREAKPKEEYEDLARRVVSYCGGLPLALEVIGSTLFEKTKEEWNSLLFKFPITMVEMRTSRAYVRKILNGCGVDADIAIRVLIQRNLIKINKNNKFGMHPLLQEIGIKIIYENSGKDLWKNRGLWFDYDVPETLQCLPVEPPSVRIAFGEPIVNSEYLLKKLRWIRLHGFSSECLPNNSYENDSTTVDLKRSLLRFMWKTPQVLLPATVNDPYCLAHMGDGHSVSFIVPEDRYMKGMTLCVVYLSTPKIIEPEFTTVVVINYTKCTFQIHNHGTVISFKDEDWHDIMSNLESGDNVEIFVNFGNGLVVKNTTVYLICGESMNMRKAFEPKKHGLIRFVKKLVM
ncbi:hypothetical protein V8G54_010549 [Vigna mungo]|uniref:TIR domain-containing protein n=1 Tax=Vigna mungo TaxID=3915 RepID=A0AAQ3S4Z7_VIGMU